MITKLTKREKEVLKLFCFNSEKISEKLLIQVSTVKTHTNRVLEKLHCKSRTSALIGAVKLGLITIDDIEINERK